MRTAEGLSGRLINQIPNRPASNSLGRDTDVGDRDRCLVQASFVLEHHSHVIEGITMPCLLARPEVSGTIERAPKMLHPTIVRAHVVERGPVVIPASTSIVSGSVDNAEDAFVRRSGGELAFLNRYNGKKKTIEIVNRMLHQAGCADLICMPRKQETVFKATVVSAVKSLIPESPRPAVTNVAQNMRNSSLGPLEDDLKEQLLPSLKDKGLCSVMVTNTKPFKTIWFEFDDQNYRRYTNYTSALDLIGEWIFNQEEGFLYEVFPRGKKPEELYSNHLEVIWGNA